MPLLAEVPAGAALVAYAYPDAILAGADRDLLASWLSAEERERHARFRFDADRDIFLVAHALTRRMLAQLCGVGVSQLEFEVREHGRPELRAPVLEPALRFNLSHTHGLVACGVARGCDIGVDCEQLDRRVELMGVARHVFSEREVAALEQLVGEAQRARFFDLWTLKEAYVKAIGKGLGAPLRAISFAAEGGDPVRVHFEPEAKDDADAWCFRRHDPGPRHRLAIALRAGADARVAFRQVSAEELLCD